MKNYTLAILALVLVSLRSPTQAQWVQAHGFRDWQNAHHSIMGANVSQVISREFYEAPSNHRLQTGFVIGIDSLRMKGQSYPSFDDRFIPNGLQRGSSSALAKMSLQSQISVIDTAIVRSTADTTRHVYSFDARAKMTSNLTQKLIGSLWVDTLRQTNTYVANGNVVSFLYEYWSNGQWVNAHRDTYTYDASNNLVSFLFEDGLNGQWVNSERGTSTYDANGKPLALVVQDWSNGQWVNIYRETFSYDANGRSTSLLEDSWSDGQWMNGYRHTFTYDASNNVLSHLTEQWSNGQWVNGWRDTYTYDASNNVLSFLYEYGSNGQWVNIWRYSYTYDVNGKFLGEVLQDWSNGQWVNSERVTYTYAVNGNIPSELGEYWSSDQWLNGWRLTSNYDANGRLTSFASDTWLNSSWTPSEWTLGLIDSAGNAYHFGHGYNFSFIRKLIVTGIASQSGGVPASYSLSQNYPNPFNPSTTIRYALTTRSHVTLSSFNTLGQQVATLVDENQDAGSHEVKFDGSNLASGVYFYRIQAGSFVQSKKFVLLR